MWPTVAPQNEPFEAICRYAREREKALGAATTSSERVLISQTGSHIRLGTPSHKNIPRHPTANKTVVPSMMPSAGPIFDPASIRLFAVPRRPSLNKLVIKTAVAGYEIDSPQPSKSLRPNRT